jgi:hypothetical protein
MWQQHDQSDHDGVDELVGRYNSFSSFSQPPAGLTSPEGFREEQQRESLHEHRHRSDARKRMNSFKTSVLSALAIIKPRSVGRVENEHWWRKSPNGHNSNRYAIPMIGWDGQK